MAISLSPHLYGPIVSWTRPRDLRALCLTCKGFYSQAVERLYDTLLLTDLTTAHLACRAILSSDRLAPFVRSLSFFQRQQSIPEHFWITLQAALGRLRNLETIFIADPTLLNTWILDSKFPFQLRDARFRLLWDDKMVRFVEGQRKLRMLQTIDTMPDPMLPLPGSLPELRVFDGPIVIALGLVECGCPLTHLQVLVDNSRPAHTLAQVVHAMLSLAPLRKTLRALSLLDLPEGPEGREEDVVVRVVDTVARVCPDLQYLGILPLPWHNRHNFLLPLMHLCSLHTLELDVARWSPQPSLLTQRALVLELQIYAPGLRCVVIWAGQNIRMVWRRRERVETEIEAGGGADVEGAGASRQWVGRVESAIYGGLYCVAV